MFDPEGHEEKSEDEMLREYGSIAVAAAPVADDSSMLLLGADPRSSFSLEVIA